MLLTLKTSASLQKQLFEAIEAENQLLEAELKIKKNPEKYLSNAIGFVADHLGYGCQEGVRIFKVSVPPLESFVAVRMQRAALLPLLNKNDLLARIGRPVSSLLMAVDLKQSGTVDRLYVADQDYLWSIDLTSMHNGQPYQYRLARLSEAIPFSNLWVVPDAKGCGVRLYFLGEHAQKAGLCMIQDPLFTLAPEEPQQNVISGVTLVVEGDYRALFVRFGRLILLPIDPSHSLKVLDLPSHQDVPVILNASHQLMSIIERISEDKLGRIAWRKIKNE